MPTRTNMVVGGLLVIAGAKLLVSSYSIFKNKSQQQQQQEQQQEQLQEQQQQQLEDNDSTAVAVESTAAPCTEGNAHHAVELLMPPSQPIRVSNSDKALVVGTSKRFSTMLETIRGSPSAADALRACSKSFADIEACCRGRPGEAQVHQIMSPTAAFVKTIRRSIIRNEQGCATEALQNEAATLAEQHVKACSAMIQAIDTRKSARGVWPVLTADPILQKRTSVFMSKFETKRESSQRQQAKSFFWLKKATSYNIISTPSDIARGYTSTTISTAALLSPVSSGNLSFRSSSASSSSPSSGGSCEGRGDSTTFRNQIITPSRTTRTSNFRLPRVSVAPGAAFVAYRSPAQTANPRGTSLSGAGAVVGRKVTTTATRQRASAKAKTPFVLG